MLFFSPNFITHHWTYVRSNVRDSRADTDHVEFRNSVFRDVQRCILELACAREPQTQIRFVGDRVIQGQAQVVARVGHVL